MTSAWARSWGESWGLSWGLTYEANQDDLYEYGRSANPNLKLGRIQDVHVSGIGAQLVISGGIGSVKAEQERTQSVHQFGVGAIVKLRTGNGKARAVQHRAILQNGTGGRLFSSAGRGRVSTGLGCAGKGAQMRLGTGRGSASSGCAVRGSGNRLSIRAGVLDDVFAVRNPTDEELAVIAYQLYKLVA